MTHTNTEKPEALRLADAVRTHDDHPRVHFYNRVAAELRRLHARVQELEASQAQRVPLTDSEIDDAWEGATGGHSFTDKTRRDFVRAI